MFGTNLERIFGQVGIYFGANTKHDTDQQDVYETLVEIMKDFMGADSAWGYVNAHPHLDQTGNIALIHNGIIENYNVIKQVLEKEGVTFQSETDSEVLVQLISKIYYNDGLSFPEAVQAALQEIVGAYGIVAICKDEPDIMVAARYGSPLVLGVGEGEYFIASDASPIVEHTRGVVYLDEGEMVVLQNDGYTISQIKDKKVVTKDISIIEHDLEAIEKGNFPHFMLKEIYDQINTITDTMRGRLLVEEGSVAGGALGSVAGPVGTAIGSMAGGAIGGKLLNGGGKVTRLKKGKESNKIKTEEVVRGTSTNAAGEKIPSKVTTEEEDYNYVTEYAAALGALAKGAGAAAQGVGRAAVRQGIKVGGKAGGRAVQQVGTAAKDAAIDAAKERAGEAAGNVVRNIGRKKPEPETDDVEEGYQRNPERGEKEEEERSKNVPGERTPMPPRGDKRREAFEKWYREQGM